MSPACEYLALFGEIPEGRGRTWLDLFLRVAKSSGLVPTHLGVAGATTAFKSERVVTWSRMRGSFETVLDQNDFRSATVYSLPEGFKQAIFDWDLASVLDRARGVLFLGAARMALFGSQTLRECLSIIDAKYGYIEKVPREWGPINRPFGFASGNEGEDEGRRLSSWRRELRGERRFLGTLLGGVYESNILAREHLQQRIGTLTLHDWISTSQHRGTLEPLNDLYLWTLPKERLELISSQLTEANLII